MFGFRLNRQKGLPPTPPKQVIPYARRVAAAIAPRTINQLVRGAEWAARFNGGGSLPLSNAANGPKLSYAGPVTVMAKLSGSGPAYNWVEVVDSPKAGFPVLTGGRSGTGNAYEANGKTGLSGSVVCLKFTPANDWRFQYISVGLPAPVGCTFCEAITDQCTSAAVVPTSAVLKSGSTVIATGTIGNQLMSVTVTAGGSGYSNGWHTVGISGGGGTGAAGEFLVSGGAVSKVSLTANGSGYTSAPTISFPGAGGTGATATATVGNTACFQAIPSGSYSLVTTATGYLDNTTSISTAVCGTATVTMTPNTRTVTVQVNNSCTGAGVANGATVTATQGGVTIATGTTNATGLVTFTGIPVGVSTTFTCSGYTRFATGTLVATIPSGCTTYNAGTITLNPASGYACWGAACEYPVPTTLNCTDSVYGAFTATYNGSGGWDGSLAISYPGGGGGTCPPCAITLNYALGPGGASSVYCNGISGPLCTCPNPTAPPGNIQDNFNETSLTCPLSFASTLTRSTFTSCIWGASGGVTVTITVTE